MQEFFFQEKSYKLLEKVLQNEEIKSLSCMYQKKDKKM